MEEKQVIAILAAILASRDKTQTIPAAVEEAKVLWSIVNTGKPLKSNYDGKIKSI
ncbi:MAG: hypothetical protein WBR26_18745 [Candidatus Acidiferrum sp.]